MKGKSISIYQKWIHSNVLVYLSILFVCLLVFSPAFNADFVNWDDNDYIYENPALLENDWSSPIENLNRIFTQKIRSIYAPLTILSFAIEESVWGFDHPGFWHMDNILLHSLNVFIVFLILRRLKFSIPVILITTILFAIHPMRVESAAWLTARKDLLYSLFFFLGILHYLKVEDGDKKRVKNIVLVWCFFLLALLAKVLAVTFPLVLILLDYYRNKSLDIKAIFAKMPYLMVSLIFGIASIYAASTFEGIDIQQPDFGFMDRLSLASTALGVYYVKVLLPYQMLPVYDYPLNLSLSHYLSLSISLVSALVLAWSFIKKKYALFFGLAFFLVNIVFTLQIIPLGQGFKADRYTYIPYFGIFLIVAVYANKLAISSRNVRLFSIVGLIFACIYGLMSFQQTKVWSNSKTLWDHQLSVTPNNLIALKDLADYYHKSNRPNLEFQYLMKANNHESKDAGSAFRTGMFITEHPNYGSLDDAIGWLSRSIEIDSNFAGVYINRAVQYAKVSRNLEALNDLARAEKIDDTNPDLYLNRAVILSTQNKTSEAILSLEKYLNLKEKDADRWVNLAQLNMKLGQYNQALPHVEQAIKLAPNNGAYYFSKALIYDNLGQAENAKTQVRLSKENGFFGQEQKAQEILNK